MLEQLRKSLKYGQVGGAFQIEHPTFLLCLIILIEANGSQRLENLSSTIVDSMWLAYEGHHYVAIGRLIQNHLGVTRRNDLTIAHFGRLGQNLIDLPLPQNFQMGIWLIEEQDGPGVGIDMGEEKQGLLQTPPGRRQVQLGARGLTVGHGDLAAFGDVLGRVQTHPEQLLDLRDQLIPIGRVWARVYLVAQISQNLSRASFA